MQRIPAYLLEGVGFFNCMLDTYLDTYLSIPQQHAVNTHLLDHEKVPSSQGVLPDNDETQLLEDLGFAAGLILATGRRS